MPSTLHRCTRLRRAPRGALYVRPRSFPRRSRARHERAERPYSDNGSLTTNRTLVQSARNRALEQIWARELRASIPRAWCRPYHPRMERFGVDHCAGECDCRVVARANGPTRLRTPDVCYQKDGQGDAGIPSDLDPKPGLLGIASGRFDREVDDL